MPFVRLASERRRQAENVLGNVAKDQVSRDGSYLIRSSFAELALYIVFTRKPEAAVELNASIRAFP